MTPNLTPEQQSREKIDKMLLSHGCVIQDIKTINFSAHFGIVEREYQREVYYADYVLFFDRIPIGLIEVKLEDKDHFLTVVEEQSDRNTKSNDKAPFESKGRIGRKCQLIGEESNSIIADLNKKLVS